MRYHRMPCGAALLAAALAITGCNRAPSPPKTGEPVAENGSRLQRYEDLPVQAAAAPRRVPPPASAASAAASAVDLATVAQAAAALRSDQ